MSATTAAAAPQVSTSTVEAPIPRITIKFCTQCKWMLRAAYFAQELLSTFSTSLGEVSLQPSTGGIFCVEITYLTPSTSDSQPQITQKILWDRKTEGGFPEVKELKRRVRDCIDPSRDLGHVDGKKAIPSAKAIPAASTSFASTPKPTPETTTTATSPTAHGSTEDEILAHSIRSLEVQPGSGMHGTATPVRGGGEEVGGEGKVDGDDRKRNPDGSICEDCV